MNRFDLLNYLIANNQIDEFFGNDRKIQKDKEKIEEEKKKKEQEKLRRSNPWDNCDEKESKDKTIKKSRR